MSMLPWIVALAAIATGVAGALALRRRNVDVIVRAGFTRRREHYDGPRHLFFSVVDHFEPLWKGAARAAALERVKPWRERYPEIARRFHDGGGRSPRHAFFYPEEDYARAPECVELLAEISRLGAGEVEVHLHHDHDTSDALRARLQTYVRLLRDQHGLLHDEPARGPVFAFVHGNWVLGNSGAGGAGCGVDDELVVLRESGCYADFTLPSAPHPSQPPIINRIYYPAGDPHRARAHFQGVDARLGTPAPAGPLIVTGPLVINWRQRRRGLLPALENGDLTAAHPPSPDRLDAWVDAGISVAGFPRWLFVKVYTHGAQERNAKLLLSDGSGSLSGLFADLLARYNDGDRHVLHFATPWEIYRAVKVLEANDTRAIDAIERFEYPF